MGEGEELELRAREKPTAFAAYQPECAGRERYFLCGYQLFGRQQGKEDSRDRARQDAWSGDGLLLSHVHENQGCAPLPEVYPGSLWGKGF